MTESTFFDLRSVNTQKSIMFYMKNVTAARLQTRQTLRSAKVFIHRFKTGRGPDLMFGSWPVETLTFSIRSIMIGHSFHPRSYQICIRGDAARLTKRSPFVHAPYNGTTRARCALDFAYDLDDGVSHFWPRSSMWTWEVPREGL